MGSLAIIGSGIGAVGKAASAAAFTTPATEFDGATEYVTKGAALTGAADSDKVSFSFMVDLAGGDGSQMIFWTQGATVGGATGRCILYRDSDNSLGLYAANTSDTTLLLVNIPASTLIAAGGRYTVLVSATTGGTLQCYINDVAKTFSGTNVAGTIDLTQADYGFAGRCNGALKLNGCLARLTYWQGLAIDWSVEANRRKVFTASGGSVGLEFDLGTPIAGFYSAAASIGTNSGTGGNFPNVNGTPVACADSPW